MSSPETSTRAHSATVLVTAFWVVAIYICAAAFFAGLSSCGGSYFVTQFLGLSIVASLGFEIFLFTRFYASRTRLRGLLEGIFLTVALLSMIVILSAGGWVYYTQPESIGTAIQEFWQALQGRHCG